MSGSVGMWQPIATAPRDETSILVFPHYVVTHWADDAIKGGWAGNWDGEWDRFHPLGFEPSHWMPLPPPPPNTPTPSDGTGGAPSPPRTADAKPGMNQPSPLGMGEWRGQAIPYDCPFPSLGKIGAPWAYNIGPGAGSARDRLQRDWPTEDHVNELRFRGGSVTALFPLPSPPKGEN